MSVPKTAVPGFYASVKNFPLRPSQCQSVINAIFSPVDHRNGMELVTKFQFHSSWAEWNWNGTGNKVPVPFQFRNGTGTCGTSGPDLKKNGITGNSSKF